MLKFFSNRKLVIFVVCLIISGALIAGSLMIRQRSKTPALQKAGNDIFGSVSRIIAIPANSLSKMSNNFNNFLATYDENESLRKDISELDATHAQNENLKAENQELKKLVDLKNSTTDYSLVASTVLNRTPSSWQDLVTIDKGTSEGVQKNQPVLAGNGLIGRVIEANYTTSKVELISDNNESANRFAIQVPTEDDDFVNGIVTGYDKKTNEIIMGQVTDSKKIKKGARVVTSGLGGVTPKGLFVGKVDKVAKDSSGLADEIRIKPAAKLNNISDVFVAKQN